MRDSFTVAAAGDAILNRRLSVFEEERFTSLFDRIRAADLSVVNLETLLHDFEGYPAATSGFPSRATTTTRFASSTSRAVPIPRSRLATRSARTPTSRTSNRTGGRSRWTGRGSGTPSRSATSYSAGLATGTTSTRRWGGAQGNRIFERHTIGYSGLLNASLSTIVSHYHLSLVTGKPEMLR